MKKCPRCDEVLEGTKIKTIYKTEILVDKCPLGCGIWFDKDEIFKSEKGEIEKIDQIEDYFIERKGDLICPVCNIKMGKYYNPVYKIDFEIDYCTKCDGLWFDQGEAIKFKKLQEEKYKKLKEETGISLKPAVQNFEKFVMEEEEANKFLKFFYSIISFFFPF